MYHYLDNKEYLHRIRAFSGTIMQELCHILKKDYDIGANFYLVGSGKKNLILQNSNKPIDLDYNLEISKCKDLDDGRYLKECVRKSFSKILEKHNLPDCEDSKSALTSKIIKVFEIPFSIDLCIVKKDLYHNVYRLIHEKTGFVNYDRYYWNIAPNSKDIKEKSDYIKKHGKWELVRSEYLDIKNHYLTQNDYTHPSFICYIEAVNHVHHTINSSETFNFINIWT